MDERTRITMILVGGLLAAALGFALALLGGNSASTAQWVGAGSGVLTTVLLTFALWGASR